MRRPVYRSILISVALTEVNKNSYRETWHSRISVLKEVPSCNLVGISYKIDVRNDDTDDVSCVYCVSRSQQSSQEPTAKTQV